MWLKSNLVSIGLLLIVAALHAETIVAKNGQTFQDASVTNVTPATLTIHHRYGVATVPFSELSTEIQQRYHYREADAQAWLAVQAERQRQQAIAAEKERQERVAAAERAKQEWRAKEAAIQARLEQMRDLVDSIYDPATREQALKNALEAKRAAEKDNAIDKAYGAAPTPH